MAGAADDTPKNDVKDDFDDRPTTPGDGPDAAFEDAFAPTKLLARDAADLEVVSALLQDAILLVKETAWIPGDRRFAFVSNRFRWEEPDARERVRTGAHFDTVKAVRVRGVDLSAGETPIVILSVFFEPDPTPPSGRILIACAGGGEIRLDVEAIEAGMADISKPWKARRIPRHLGGPA